MVEAPGLALAFAAGLVSFLSPCCLGLLPGYVATVAGPAGSEAAGADREVVPHPRGDGRRLRRVRARRAER